MQQVALSRVTRRLCSHAQIAAWASSRITYARGADLTCVSKSKYRSTTSTGDERPAKHSPAQGSEGDPYHRGYFDFGSASYWDDFYAKKVSNGQGWFEWFESADASLPAVQQAARRVSKALNKPKLRILHVGAGTSTLGVRLAQNGHSVVNIDVCAAAVEFARENLSGYIAAAPAVAVAAAAASSSGPAVGENSTSDSGPCTFEELNVFDLEAHFGAEAFDMVVDKGTLDALLFRDDDGGQRMCRQVHAVLRPFGSYCQITREDPELRFDVFVQEDLPWSVVWEALEGTDQGEGGVFDETSFMFTCTKAASTEQGQI